MKIFFVGSKGIPANSGGIEQHVEKLTTRLAKKNEVFVYCRKHYTKYTQPKYRNINLIYIPSIATKNLDAITHTFFCVIHLLFKKADIVHFHGIGPSSLAWITRLLKPTTITICTYHSADYHHQKWGWFAKTYLKFGEVVCSTIPHATIAVSKTIAEYIKSVYESDSYYIPNGIENQNGIMETGILKKFGLVSKQYILTVNRLIPHKGIHHLIVAYKNLLPSEKLVIVGDSSFTDNYKSELLNLAQENKNIIFTSQLAQADIITLYKNAAVYVHPSEYEGLSISLLEALSCGAPVLASDIKPNKEVIGTELGLLFKNRDVYDLQQKLSAMLLNKESINEIGKKASLVINKEYNWDIIAKKNEILYKTLQAELHPVKKTLSQKTNTSPLK